MLIYTPQVAQLMTNPAVLREDGWLTLAMFGMLVVAGFIVYAHEALVRTFEESAQAKNRRAA